MNNDSSRRRRRKQPAGRPSPIPAWSNALANYDQTTVVMHAPPLTNLGKNSFEHRAPQAAVGPTPRWMTVKRLAQEYKDCTTEAALRNLIWNAEAYARHPKAGLRSNGFLPVIVRLPNQRKVLLDRIEFEKWMTSTGSTDRSNEPTLLKKKQHETGHEKA